MIDEFIITDVRIEMDAFDLFMHSGNCVIATREQNRN